jgi:hypothetical protein
MGPSAIQKPIIVLHHCWAYVSQYMEFQNADPETEPQIVNEASKHW